MIEFHTLGTLDLRQREGESVPALLVQPKRIGLLAYLTLARPHGWVRRDVLLALFWPELDTERARASLRTALHRMRVALGDEAIVGRGAEQIALNQRVVWCDAVAFDAALEAEQPATALELYRGPLLPGFFVADAAPDFEQWLDEERARLQNRAAAAAWQLAQQAQREGRVTAAISWARQAVTLRPDDESGVRTLLGLLAASGDRTGALKEYRGFAEHIENLYGITPSAETLTLVETIVEPRKTRASATTAPVSPPAELEASYPEASYAEAVSGPPTTVRVWQRPRAGFAGLVLVALAVLLRGHGSHAGFSGSPQTSSAAGELSLRATAADALGNQRWRALATLPVARSHHTAFADARRHEVLIYGGRNADLIFGDVLRYSPGDLRWTQVSTDGPAPEPRWGHTTAYDAATDRMILFGGARGLATPCSNDVWVLTHASGRTGRPAWSRLTPDGQPPAPRADHVAAYDHANNRLIVYGGHDCIAPRFDDVWVLTHANGVGGEPAWHQGQVSGAKPHARSAFAADYDASRNALIIFGGEDADPATDRGVFANPWILEHANGRGGSPSWREIVVAGPGPTSPSHHTAFYDSDRDALIVFGGNVPDGGPMNDVWLLRNALRPDRQPEWRRLDYGAAALSRMAAAAAFDSATDQLTVIGGMALMGDVPVTLPDAWTLRIR